MHAIPVRACARQALQHEESYALAAHDAARARIERPASAVLGEEARPRVKDIHRPIEDDVHAARYGERARFLGLQTLTGEVDRHQ